MPVSQNDDVFDVLAGDGEMYRYCWHQSGGGVCLDKIEHCTSRAAMERPGWTVIRCDAHKVLRAGAWRRRPFSIVDVDVFGSPWRWLHELFRTRREIADPCRLILTDHYAHNRNISAEDSVLGFKKPGTHKDYEKCIDRLLAKMIGGPYERKVDRLLFSDGKAVQHLITISSS